MSNQVAVAASHLHKTFKPKAKSPVVAVNDVSLKICRGTIYGLLGPNGAGKTTLIKMLCGLILPDSGQVFIEGYDIDRQRKQALRYIGCVLEGTRNVYLHMKVVDNLRYFGYLCRLPSKVLKRRIAYLLSLVELEHKANEYVYNLSRGMQQKLAIAVALLKDPSVVFLDEPTLGLDVMSSNRLKQTIRRLAAENKTIILTTHNMQVAEELCSCMGILNNGLLIEEQPPDALIDRYRVELKYTLRFAKQDKWYLMPVLQGEQVGYESADDGLVVRLNESQTKTMAVLLQQARPLEIEVEHESLEQVFLRVIGSDSK